MGYWRLPDNAKHPVGHYLALIPRSLEMLRGERLIFFTDDPSIRQMVETCCKRNAVSVISLSKEVPDLPAFESAAAIVQQTALFGSDTEPPRAFNNEKGLLHYWRDFVGSGPVQYRKILAIWLSKVLLMHECVVRNPFESGHFAWIDASISRFNSHRANWNFVKVADRDGVICHYSSRMRKWGLPLTINASFLKGDSRTWARLAGLYSDELREAARERYPNDEETILHGVNAKHVTMFSPIDALPA
jgi:hypothetical protein